MRNILTFDVEDWQQSTLDPALPISPRVLDNTRRVLEMLEEASVRGTFFVLGLVAERFPALVRQIASAGHEIASHGHSHRPVYAMNREQFRTDLRRSLSAIEDAAGVKVVGYRAPDFSVPATALWALEILAEEGLVYDSSVFPFRGPRYGVREAFDSPFTVRCLANPALVEFPLTTTTYLGIRVPAAGGGYFRLFPYAHSRRAIRAHNGRGAPATAYFHPYELDTEEIYRSDHDIPLRVRITQGTGRHRVESRMKRLLADFRWGPACGWLGDAGRLTGGRLLDLTGAGARWFREGPAS